MTSLAKRSAHAALWNYFGNATRLLLQLAIGVALARLLGPEAFGLVALALIVISFGQLVADFGFTSAIVQAREVSRADVDYLFTLQLGLGTALTVLCVLTASLLAALFREPAAAGVIAALAPTFLLRALGQTSVALLTRELRFRAVQTGAIGSYLLGYAAVGLGLAFSGYGVWSLVVAQLAQSTLASLFAIFQSGQLPKLRVRGGRRDLVHFGRLVILANLSSWLLLNADSMIVGRMAGPSALGLYNRAMNLAAAPAGAVVTSLQGVLFAASSRAQDNRDVVRQSVLASAALFVLLSGSVLLAMAATAPTVILGLYGPRWAEAAPLLVPLAMALIVHGLLAFFGPALNGLGQVAKEVRAQWLTVVIMLPLVLGAARISVEAIAWAVLIVYLVRLALLASALHAVVRFQIRAVASAIGPTLAVALAAAGAAAIGDRLGAGSSAELRLAAATLAAALGMLIGLLAMRRPLLRGPLVELLLRAEVLPERAQRRLTAMRLR